MARVVQTNGLSSLINFYVTSSHSSATLKGIMLRYPTAMSTSKLKNMKFKVSQFWCEKRPTENSEDRIPTMLGQATPHCIAESDQRHAQHPLKTLSIDFSRGSYQTTSEWIMDLNSWYQTHISLYANRYLFIGSKIGGQKWQPHILRKTMLIFTSWLMPLVHLATMHNCTEGDMHRNANVPIVIP